MPNRLLVVVEIERICTLLPVHYEGVRNGRNQNDEHELVLTGQYREERWTACAFGRCFCVDSECWRTGMTVEVNSRTSEAPIVGSWDLGI